MKSLLEELVRRGLLDGFGENDWHLSDLIRAIYWMRRGALHAALHDLGSVETWGPRELALFRACLPEEMLLNAACEAMHHRYKNESLPASVPLVLGAALGPRAGEIATYYAEARVFVTRVIGIAHHDAFPLIDHLRPGQRVILEWEPDNPYDPNAMRAILTSGRTLGYLRRTVAAVLAPQARQGAQFGAEVVCVGPERWPANQRVYVWIRRSVDREPVITFGDAPRRIVLDPGAGLLDDRIAFEGYDSAGQGVMPGGVVPHGSVWPGVPETGGAARGGIAR